MTVLGPAFSPLEKMMSVRPKDTRLALWVGVAPRYFTYHSPAFAGAATRMCRSSNARVFTAESAADTANAASTRKGAANNTRKFIPPPVEGRTLEQISVLT